MAELPQEAESPARWLPGPTWPLWAAATFFYASILPWLLAFGVAVQGRISWGAVGAATVGPATAMWGEREYWRLEPLDRLRVWRATTSGRPTGEPVLDAIVLDRLIKAAASEKWDRAVLCVIGVVLTAIPIIAACGNPYGGSSLCYQWSYGFRQFVTG